MLGLRTPRLTFLAVAIHQLDKSAALVNFMRYKLHKVVEKRVKNNRERQQQAASRGQLPNVAVKDYVMAARVRWPGSTTKLVSTWTGPWQVVTADKVQVYNVQNIVIKAVVNTAGGFWPIGVFFAGYRSFLFVPSRQTQTKARL